MDNNLALASILEKQKKRYALLVKIYELTDGDETKMVMLEDPSLEPEELQSLVDYLAGEGLVKSHADEVPLVSITHRGVIEVEQSIVNPKQPTEHFVAQVIQNFHGAVGSVQTGNQNVAHVTQISNVDPELTSLLEELRRHIVEELPEQRIEGLAILDGLVTEVASEVRSKSRIKLFLKGLESFTKDTGKNLIVRIGTMLISDQFGLSE